MHPKHNAPRKPKQGAPSTGRGAASAMDALIQKRVPAPESSVTPQPQPQAEPKHAKKH